MNFMQNLPEFLMLEYFGNTMQDYCIAIGIFLVATLAFHLFRHRALRAMRKLSKKTKTKIDDHIIETVEKMPKSLYMLLAIYIALPAIDPPAIVPRILNIILIVSIFFWATKTASSLVEFSLRAISKDKKKDERGNAYFALTLLAKVVLWSVGILLILANLGINVSALVASLGIGGIAVALAVQSILGDMFSSFSIYLDRPFEVGDFIIVGDTMGTVEKIGIKTTRIKALQGEEIVISNHELTTARIHNYKKMQKRRIVFGFGVTYDTPKTKLEKIPGIVRDIIKKVKLADIDRVNFKAFGASSLDYEVVYFMKTGDYNEYMNTQEEINLSIVGAFAKEKIEMAFPTRTIYMKKD